MATATIDKRLARRLSSIPSILKAIPQLQHVRTKEKSCCSEVMIEKVDVNKVKVILGNLTEQQLQAVKDVLKVDKISLSYLTSTKKVVNKVV